MRLFIEVYVVLIALLVCVITWDLRHLWRANRPNRRLNSWRRWLPLGRSWRRML